MDLNQEYPWLQHQEPHQPKHKKAMWQPFPRWERQKIYRKHQGLVKLLGPVTMGLYPNRAFLALPKCLCQHAVGVFTPPQVVSLPEDWKTNNWESLSPSIIHHHSLFPPPWPTPGQPGGAGRCFISTTRVIASASKTETCLNQFDHSHVPRKLALLKENKGRNASQPGKADSFRASSSQELISRIISSGAGRGWIWQGLWVCTCVCFTTVSQLLVDGVLITLTQSSPIINKASKSLLPRKEKWSGWGGFPEPTLSPKACQAVINHFRVFADL